MQGMNPDTTYYNSKSPIIIPMGAYAAPWVVNGDGPGGPESVAAATTISDNVVFAQLSVDVGPENTVDGRPQDGHHQPARLRCPRSRSAPQASRPLEMADAYATLASGGIHHPPQAIVKVVLPQRPRRPGSPGPRARGPSPPASPQRRHAVPRARGRPPAPGRRPAPTSRTRAPARPAPQRRAGTSGSAATRRSSPPPCGWATPRRTRPWTARTAVRTARRCGASSSPRPSRTSRTRASAASPWTFGAWHGKYSRHVAVGVTLGIRAALRRRRGPTKTIKPDGRRRHPRRRPPSPRRRRRSPRRRPPSPRRRPTPDGGGIGQKAAAPDRRRRPPRATARDGLAGAAAGCPPACFGPEGPALTSSRSARSPCGTP